jgi:hypothetical protein
MKLSSRAGAGAAGWVVAYMSHKSQFEPISSPIGVDNMPVQ